MGEDFFCTRPRMAAFLIARGHKAKQTVNPFAPERRAWVFDKTCKLIADVDEYRAIVTPGQKGGVD